MPDWTEERRKLKAEQKWGTLSQDEPDQFAKHAVKKLKENQKEKHEAAAVRVIQHARLYAC